MTIDLSDSFVSGVATGLVSGIATGLVLAGFFWLISKFRRLSERKEKILYLAHLISTHRELMYKPAHPVGPPIETDTGKDIFRKVEFERMKSQLTIALDGRCSRLTFDEINQLRSIVNAWSYITDNWNHAQLNWTDVFCGNIFGELESIKWLNLAKGPDFYGLHEKSSDDDRDG